MSNNPIDNIDQFQLDVATALSESPVRACMALGLAYHSGNLELINKVALALGQAGQACSAIGDLNISGSRLLMDMHHAVKRIPAKPANLRRACARRARAIDVLLHEHADAETWASYIDRRDQAWRAL